MTDLQFCTLKAPPTKKKKKKKEKMEAAVFVLFCLEGKDHSIKLFFEKGIFEKNMTVKSTCIFFFN